LINYLSLQKKNEDIYYGSRFWLDNIYTVIIYFFILQIVGAIIIDNFTSLRQEDEVVTNDKNNECFICGLSKFEINRLYDNEEGFINHIQLDHYFWNYLFLLINLKEEKEKEKEDELNVDDEFILNCYKKQSLNWIPER